MNPFLTIVQKIGAIVNVIIPILLAAAVAFFFWGVITYVIQSDPAKKADSKKTMIYGIIGLFVMVAVWGLVGLVARFVGVENDLGRNQNAPTVNGVGGGANSNLSPGLPPGDFIVPDDSAT